MPTIFKKTAKLSPAILTVFTLFGLLFIFADSVKAAPSIDSITPNEVDSIDSPVDVTVSGSGFSTSSVKILDDSGREISSASTTVVDSTQINCEFDVSGYVGVWDVKVINGDNSSSTLADSLTINYVGRITSQIHDAGLDKYFSNISWTADTGANSSVTVYVRTATTSDMSTAPDWSTCDPVTSGNDISGNNCVTDGHRYVQYRAVLSSSAANDIPEIKDINISYYGNGTLESSYFNSTVSNNTLQDISWRQQLEGNSGVIMYLRTATTSAGLSGASWHEIASSTNFGYLTDGCSLSSVNSETDQVDCASSTIPAELRDGSGDQWLQYRAGLVTFDGISIPTVTWISPNYNAMIPVLATVTPASKVDNLDTSQITITGSGFVSGAMVKLENGSGLSVTASSTVASSTEIRADFDLSGYAGDFDLVVTNPNGSSGSKDYQIDNVGRFTSQIRDPGSDLNPTYVSGTIDWTATTSATTSVSLKLRSDSSSDMSGADAWSSCTPVSHNQDIFASNCVHDGDRYLQYRAVLRSSSSEDIPTLNNVTINLQSSGSLTSSQFDSSDSNNIMGGGEWTQQVPTGGITLYYRTASSSNGLSGASWHEIASSTSAGQVTSGCTLSGSGTTTVDCDNSVFPDALSDSVEDQWFQYKVEISTGSTSPRFFEINTTYVVNEPPQLHNVTATQTASGQIEISYQVRDVDTTLAKYTPGEVTPAFEYSLDGGSTWYTPTSSCFAAGDWDNKTVQEDAWSSYTATWDAECDPNLTDRYSTTTVIRLTMDDNE